MNSLKNISPLDGRYANSIKDLSAYFSESALIAYRIKVEIEYLIALGNEKGIKELSPFSKDEQIRLRKIYENFDSDGSEKVKEIEATTNHDVKAVEYFIQSKVKKALHPWIHFALTSEDINNLSYSLMWQEGLKQIYLTTLQSVNKELKKLARRYKNSSMLALTHGQPATPTTFGKELAVFCARLDRQTSQINSHSLLGKFGGATGTWSAHLVAYPKVNWTQFSSKFIKSLGLEANLITTQIEPHDSLAESFHQVVRVNSILTDLCRDMWAYISRGILGQKKVAGEVGSSTMPHKINPIQFENAEGNMGIANALLNHLAIKLPISRMQRDLTDSTTLRNQGVALGHSYLALQNIKKGLSRITINNTQMTNELNNHWEVLAEAIQTILRKNGKQDAYEQLKELTRGQSINADSMAKFVAELKISDDDKRTLLELTPKNYIGLAGKLVELL
ncbi:MAG: adenylosuccinate lyase [Candidatus Marinimicrobia bacterium]|mgnify:FL=1|jgi:adenylosuccinate lyase|nr:adenylosuccinate lyase [Candidatus Neomarinimicrobiota bacterium]MBT5364010.1 adenylosuccinate lyase [Candidatus Neomarinimicrobiota bacterium]MBT5461685.1 adenylosuccinate lyase [Candidatus Neomarinimicrobiota bacterium]MBT5720932.1 adenylosuccinate lyase [Candidatus Neomarinimicrobiota bacterium]